MAELKGLPGIKEASREAERIDKPADIEKILERGLAGTTAGDDGAINVWKDDEGNVRCERHRFLAVVDAQTFTKMKDAIKWTKEAISLIERQ